MASARTGYNDELTIHSGQYPIRRRGTSSDTVQMLTVTVTQDIDFKLRIVLSDAMDPSFLCVLIIAQADYEEIKKSQGLLIDFESFPGQFVRLLQQCESGNMFLSLHQQGPSVIYLEIIERNDFKRLVHLSLKTGPASDADIKRNMAENILLLRKNLASVTSSLDAKETMFLEKEKFLELRVNDLNMSLSKLNNEKLDREHEFQDMLKREREKYEDEKHDLKKTFEAHSKNQNFTMQDSLSKKEKQLEDTVSRCRQLQDTVKSLESQIIDKGQRVLTLEKQLHAVKSDAEALRNQNGMLDRDYHDKDQNLLQLKSRLMDVEKALKDKSDLLRDTLDSLQSLQREKILLDERTNHNETLLSKRHFELQDTSEQLQKANQIIVKQNNDILELREKLMCRTAIVLEQEKVIEENSKEMSHFAQKEKKLHVEIEKNEKTIDQLQIELDSYKQVADEKGEIIKNNNAVIQWLHKKLDAVETPKEYGCKSTDASTPFTLPLPPVSFDNHKGLQDINRNRLSDAYSAGLSDNLTTKGSYNTMENYQQEQQEYGVDPIYLQPSSRKSQESLPKAPSTSSTVQSKNKENKKKIPNKTLKPDLKKSQNEGRYKTSAISAYFPKS